MTTKFFTGGALTALAAALAFTAVPASAQDWHRKHDNDRSAQSSRDDGDSSSSRDDRSSSPARKNDDAPAWGSRNRGDTPQRTNTPAATQSHGQWSGRHVDNHDEAQARATANGGWQGWGGNRATGVAQADRPYTDRGRNSTYVDRNRNTTYRNDNRDDHRDWRNDSHHNDRTYRDTRNYQRWDRNWRNNNRYDWQRYRTYNRYAYHLRPYYAPYRGYSYRRFEIGVRLDPLFFGQDYWIGDPGYYRLPDVYGPYRWVRYYNDALLVNIYDGEVVDVIHDFFW